MDRTDRRPALQNCFSNLYLFKVEDTKHLDTPPIVNAVLMCLASHVTLPIENAVSFKDILDSRIDQDEWSCLSLLFYSLTIQTFLPEVDVVASSQDVKLDKFFTWVLRRGPIQYLHCGTQ